MSTSRSCTTDAEIILISLTEAEPDERGFDPDFEDTGPPDYTDVAGTVQRVLDGVESGQSLYEGAPFTALAASAGLLNFGYVAGLSIAKQDELFNIVHRLLPQENHLPSSSKDAEKKLLQLRRGYRVIHCCPNDCMLFNEDLAGAQACIKCNEPRYKGDGLGKKPRKACYSWSIAEAAATMFSTPKKARKVRAHERLRSKDGAVRTIHGKLAGRSAYVYNFSSPSLPRQHPVLVAYVIHDHSASLSRIVLNFLEHRSGLCMNRITSVTLYMV
jgi:hypothetical protein